MTTNVSQLFPLKGGPGAWALVMLPLVGCMLGALVADPALYGYERSETLAGAWWRPLTAQFLHLDALHLAVNLGAWLLLCALLLPRMASGAALATVLGGLAGTAAGLILTPSIAWYVGLSGALHGVLAGGALVLLGRDGRLGCVLLVLVVAKLGWEALFGPLPGERLPAGARIVTEAHLWGALGGGLAGGAVRLLTAGGPRV